MQGGSRAKRPNQRIQGGWASDIPLLGQGRGRSRGRGRARQAPPLRNQGPSPDVHHQGYDTHGIQPPYRADASNSPNMDFNVVFMEPNATSFGPQQLPCGSQYHMGQPQNVQFAATFVQPDEPIQRFEEPITIEKSCKEVISSEPTGISEVQLITDFLDRTEADEAFSHLQEEINWIQQINKNRAGEEYEEPRRVAWYGEFPYAYSKVKMEPNSVWPPMLSQLKEKIERAASLTFNSVLANQYRNEKDGVAWHSDDEYGLREQPKIASLSLGETRMFEMRKKPPKGYDTWNYDYTESKKYKIPLTHGSLLLMTGCTQDDWQHRVPKEYHNKDMRINLTFRTIYPDERHQSHTDN